MKRIFILMCISIYISGCSWVVDLPRSLWGSSIRVLSEKRSEAETQVFSCSREACFESVLAMTLPYGAEDRGGDKFVLFAQDKRKQYMIIMGVPGSVDTTEVGVFFDLSDDARTKVELSSLSSRAKQAAAEIIFGKLSATFNPAF